jgi:hypothetical protein
MLKTNLDKWSVGLILIMFLLFIIGSSHSDTLYQSVPAGGTVLADIDSRPALAISMLAGFGTGISVLVRGLICIIKHKNRSVLVILSTLTGAALTVFLIA